jgi:hypothetical protein
MGKMSKLEREFRNLSRKVNKVKKADLDRKKLILKLQIHCPFSKTGDLCGVLLQNGLCPYHSEKLCPITFK